MDLFEYHTLEEDINNEIVFTRSQPQGYYTFINNLKRLGNLIYNYKLELKRGPRQTDQIYDTPQGEKSSLDFVMLHCAEEEKLGDKRESSSRKLIRSHKGGSNKPFENQIICDDEKVDAQKTPRLTKPSNLISNLLSNLASHQ